jgi:DNA-binding NarL/FixJ family response regulator
MRIVLVGRAGERARLRLDLQGWLIEVVGEFETLADARAAAIRADAWLLANIESNDRRPHPDDWIEEKLTPRELAVLELLAEGLSNKAIAERLEISDQTVKFHVASIAGKLGVSSRTAVVRRALRLGLLRL